MKIENATEEIPVQSQPKVAQSNIKREVTNESRLKAELLSVRSEYCETFLQLQNEKKVSSSLRDENTAYVDQIKSMDETMKSLRQEKLDLLQKSKKIDSLASSLENDKKILSRKLSAAEKTIDEMQKEKAATLARSNVQKKELDSLKARVKQLQFGVQQNSNNYREQEKEHPAKEEDFDESVLEVQKLLEHKTIKKERNFLVRWKGYDSSEDSWVPESRLNCSRILKLYLKSKNLH